MSDKKSFYRTMCGNVDYVNDRFPGTINSVLAYKGYTIKLKGNIVLWDRYAQIVNGDTRETTKDNNVFKKEVCLPFSIACQMLYSYGFSIHDSYIMSFKY